MTRIDSTRVKWRVQVRKSRAHAWKNKGLFETREAARDECAWLRGSHQLPEGQRVVAVHGYGFGNTRTVRHISGKGKAL